MTGRPISTTRLLIAGVLGLWSCGRQMADSGIPTTGTSRQAETQADRDALVALLEIRPANATIKLGQQIVFVGIPRSATNSPVSGVVVTWAASAGGVVAPLFCPAAPFSSASRGDHIHPTDRGEQAQHNHTVRGRGTPH